MKKIIALVLALVCALALVACSNAEPEIITKTCTGEVTSIDLDEEVLTVLDEKTNEEISFSGTMFRKIIQYEDKNYWEEHPTIRLLTEFEDKEYEVLSVFRDRVYYKHEDVFKFYNFIDAEDEAAYYDAIANFKAKAIYDTGVEPEYGDQLITLVTCAYHTENGRFVVVACEKNSDN